MWCSSKESLSIVESAIFTNQVGKFNDIPGQGRLFVKDEPDHIRIGTCAASVASICELISEKCAATSMIGFSQETLTDWPICPSVKVLIPVEADGLSTVGLLVFF